MAWADDFDITMPDGDVNSIDEGDDQIRGDKRAIQERMAWAYGFAASGETDNLKMGVNRVPFNENSDNPVAVADQIILFAKEAADKAELFMIDEDENVRQLTSGGSWIGGMEKEVKMWFGALADLPAGVYLCNGEGGRPDLRNQFIICAQEDDEGVAKAELLFTEWVNAADYVEGDLASWGGANYICIQDHTSNAATDRPGDGTNWESYWTELAASLYQAGGSIFHSHYAGGYCIPDHGHIMNMIGTTLGGGSVASGQTQDRIYSEGVLCEDEEDRPKILGQSGESVHLPPFYALAFVSTYNVD